MFREAADIAYYFKWPKREILEMTGRERSEWLGQIQRIHEAEQRQRVYESQNEMRRLLEIMSPEEGQGV